MTMPKLFVQLSLLLGLLGALVGCQSTTTSSSKEPARVRANTDPCAERLHELSGAFLLYYATYHRLPDTLEQLRKVDPALVSMPFSCPVSEQPYIYNRQGLVVKEWPGRVIVYDPTPSDTNLRWAISIIEPEAPGPLITKVLAISESRFAATPPPAEAPKPQP
ncbi:MAG TPA: hypothetical protein VHP11_06365 [Tepidisphaeraceae bacterium]|nr:hypothetical protein [Tepidisphaeraceae bacterium]